MNAELIALILAYSIIAGYVAVLWHLTCGILLQRPVLRPALGRLLNWTLRKWAERRARLRYEAEIATLNQKRHPYRNLVK